MYLVMSVAGKSLYVKFIFLHGFSSSGGFSAILNFQSIVGFQTYLLEAVGSPRCKELSRSLVLSPNYGCRASSRGSRVNCFCGTELMQRNQLTAIKRVRTPNLLYIKLICF